MFPQNNPDQKNELRDNPADLSSLSPQPDQATTPTMPEFESTTVRSEQSSQLPSAKSKGRSKKPFIIAGAVIVTLLLTGGVAAALYTSKEKSVTDAFAKVLTATSGSMKGSLKIESLDESGDVTVVTLNQLQYNTTDFLIDAEAAITQDENSMIARGGAVVTNEAFAFKIQNFRELVSEMMGLSDADTEVISVYSGLIALLDNKWVVITKEDIETLTGEQDTDQGMTCVQDTLKTFRQNKSWRDEVVKLYKDNAFVRMSDGMGIESVDGRNSQRYELGLDERTYREFNKGVVDTSVFKAFDDCVEDDLRADYEQQADEPLFDDDEETKTELWVDVLSHEPTRVRVTTTDSEMKSTFDSTVRLNTNPVIAMPQAQTTLYDLTSEIESIQTQMFSEQTDFEASTSVLGVQLLR